MTEHAHDAFFENTKFRMMKKQTSLKKNTYNTWVTFNLLKKYKMEMNKKGGLPAKH